MNTMKTLLAVAALVALSTDTQAGLLGKRLACGSSKCCDCAPTFQPRCCKPQIVRPCHRNCYNYQRTCAKPMNCCGTSPGNSCCPVNNNCCDTGCGTGACGNNCCNTTSQCAAPCGTDCCNNILSNIGCGNGCGTNCCDTGCGNNCCDTGCGDDCCATTCCPDNSCAIAELIYISQTACYARQRRAAIHKLGDKFDCCCNPEIMSAFIYALNDADQRVRAKAADEIGDQVRRNHCCCSQCVVAALTNGLADCDRVVRRECEQGLRLCGFDVVNGNCEVCCDSTCCDGGTCCNTGCTTCAPAGVPAGVPVDAVPAAPAAPTHDAAPEVAPAPAPPEEERAYYPKRLPEQTARPISARQSLSRLFSFK